MSPELSRPIDVRHLPERVTIEAIERFDAQVTLEPTSAAILVEGRIEADVVQACAVSGEPLRVHIAEPFSLRLVPAATLGKPGEEIELDADDCDEIAYEGTQFDLGEAVAQSLSLAIDPYATGPNADRARAEAGIVDQSATGPFAALAALKK